MKFFITLHIIGALLTAIVAGALFAPEEKVPPLLVKPGNTISNHIRGEIQQRLLRQEKELDQEELVLRKKLIEEKYEPELKRLRKRRDALRDEVKKAAPPSAVEAKP